MGHGGHDGRSHPAVFTYIAFQLYYLLFTRGLAVTGRLIGDEDGEEKREHALSD
jgi:hypothetical protein